MMSPQKRIDQLYSYDKAYYQEGKRLVSDAEYDQLKASLTSQGLYTPEIKDLQSSQPKIQHTSKMYSMANVYDRRSLQKWLAKFDNEPMYVSLKRDGVALSLSYNDVGHLETISLRGTDGKEGADVTRKLWVLSTIPKDISFRNVEIHAECFVSQEMHASSYLKDKYATALMATVGIVSQITSSVDDVESLTIEAYGCPALLSSYPTHAMLMQELHSAGFATTKTYGIKESLDDIDAIYRSITTPQSHTADGLVIRVNNNKIADELGYTRTVPRFMVAYKFPANATPATITSLSTTVGYTGRLTPTLNICPIVLSGKTITAINGHNYNNIIKKQYGVGAVIDVHLGGGVIPVAGEVISKPNIVFEIPAVCPSCLSPILQRGDNVFCTNSCCTAMVTQKILRGCGLQGIGIRGLTYSDVFDLCDNNIIVGTFDFLRLRRDTLVEFFGKTYGVRLYDQLHSIDPKSIPIHVLLHALCIPNLTSTNIDKVIQNKNFAISDLFRILGNRTGLISMGISPIAAETISQHVNHRDVYYEDQISSMLYYISGE